MKTSSFNKPEETEAEAEARTEGVTEEEVVEVVEEGGERVESVRRRRRLSAGIVWLSLIRTVSLTPSSMAVLRALALIIFASCPVSSVPAFRASMAERAELMTGWERVAAGGVVRRDEERARERSREEWERRRDSRVDIEEREGGRE